MENEQIIRLGLATALSIVPAAIWGYIFYKKQVGKKSMVFRTFLVGALFVIPLILYKELWQFFPWLNAFKYTNAVQGDLLGFTRIEFIPISVILTFMVVGVIEEVIKLFAVKATDKHQIQSVDDAMEMAFTAALGFAFAENILYFYNIMAFRGVEGILYPFIFRSMFSTFAHIMFSGVLGYYYGLALFATDIVKEEHNKKKFAFTRTLARIFHMKKSTLFHEEKMMEGVLLAVVLHAIFNIFLEMEWTFLIVPYLTAGFMLLTYLLNKKESHKVYAHVDDNRNDHLHMQQLSSTLPLDQREKA